MNHIEQARIDGLLAELTVAKRALQELADAAEEFASSDLDMPSHAETEKRLDAALESARVALVDL